MTSFTSNVEVLIIEGRNDSLVGVVTVNDGFVRCEDTTSDAAAWSPDSVGPPPTNPYTFNGPDGGLSASPTTATGPVLMVEIGPDGEDSVVGCYGSQAAMDAGDTAKPLTCSCWTSLHPDAL